MASFLLPPNEQNMKNNHDYKGNGNYNANTKVPYKVDITPWVRDRDRPYAINQGTGEYAKTTADRNRIWKQNGCDRYKRTRYSQRPAKCKWSFFSSWSRKVRRENESKSYRDQARHKREVSDANKNFLKKKSDDLSNYTRQINRDNNAYKDETNKINTYYYPQHKKTEKQTEQNKNTAIKQRNAAENERDITYGQMIQKRQDREDKTNEISEKTDSLNNKITNRDKTKGEIQNTLENIDVTQSNLLMEDQTLKDNWLLNYYYALGNKRKQLTFGEFKKQNESLEKKTNKVLKTNTLYDRENMYLQEQNMYLLLFNRNALILYYLLFFYFAYIFLKYRQDASLQTKLLYLAPLSIFPFLVTIFIYLFHYIKIMLK
jgi:hypothetical protein